ncbi:hypothetical protein [Zooshikella harenae]|uniref:Uncharacterized protein n=1 Tax=Zooshikella harenae TaxID=2827238 RepID=A0ABS5Z9N5_9GAMM|nr:hypothetical protein [Zooshikella harenae]MBU2710768.1 hypothetical protein [Zooshikella harenae]
MKYYLARYVYIILFNLFYCNYCYPIECLSNSSKQIKFDLEVKTDDQYNITTIKMDSSNPEAYADKVFYLEKKDDIKESFALWHSINLNVDLGTEFFVDSLIDELFIKVSGVKDQVAISVPDIENKIITETTETSGCNYYQDDVSHGLWKISGNAKSLQVYIKSTVELEAEAYILDPKGRHSFGKEPQKIGDPFYSISGEFEIYNDNIKLEANKVRLLKSNKNDTKTIVESTLPLCDSAVKSREELFIILIDPQKFPKKAFACQDISSKEGLSEKLFIHLRLTESISYQKGYILEIEGMINQREKFKRQVEI